MLKNDHAPGFKHKTKVQQRCCVQVDKLIPFVMPGTKILDGSEQLNIALQKNSNVNSWRLDHTSKRIEPKSPYTLL